MLFIIFCECFYYILLWVNVCDSVNLFAALFDTTQVNAGSGVYQLGGLETVLQQNENWGVHFS